MVQPVKIMPITHITTPMNFLSIVGTQELTVAKCKVFNEDLLYFFYGRPAYTPLGDVLSTSQPGFRPVCFLIDPSALTEIKRMFPFDSGAFIKGLYARHIPPYMSLSDFEISGDLNQAAEFVSRFFGTNKAYYFGKAKMNLSLPATDFVGHAYKAILTDCGVTEFDGRRGTIEIHAIKNVLLTKQSVKAICLPFDFLEDTVLRSRLTDDWQCKILTYDVYHDQPSHDIREVLVRVKDYLEEEQLL